MEISKVARAARQTADNAEYRSNQGASAGTASSNTSSLTNGSPQSGTTVTFSTTITPKVGGKIALWGYASGTGTAADVVTTTLRIAGVALRQSTCEVGASAGNTWNAGGLSLIDDNSGAGYPVGVPVTVDVHVTCADSVTVPTQQIGITAQEVPLK